MNMGSSDKFCLRWNDFESNIGASFRDLRKDSEFFDVTLCCNNGSDVIKAHRLILAACSPLLRKVLNHQKDQNNPLLYLKGVGLKELEALLSFMYYGEANVEQDSLDNFLTLAEDLEVKGLTADAKPTPSSTKTAKKSVKRQPSPVVQNLKNVKKAKRSKPLGNDTQQQKISHEIANNSDKPDMDQVLDDDYVDVEVEEFDDYADYEQFNNANIGESSGFANESDIMDMASTSVPNIKDEPLDSEMAGISTEQDSQHITIGGTGGIDFSLVCKYCNGKYIAPTKPALRKHVSRFHGDQHEKYSKSAMDPLVNNFPCKDCSYKGPSNTALRQHRFRNHNPKGYKCKECSFRGSDLNQMSEHMLKDHGVVFNVPLKLEGNLPTSEENLPNSMENLPNSVGNLPTSDLK